MATPNLHIKARDLMQTRMVAVTRQYSARDLSILIHSGTFSGVPVIEPGNHLVGMVTEFDVLKALVDGKDLHGLKAEDVMTMNPVTVEETATAEEIVQRMIKHQIIRIPVVRDGKLLGMVSRTDLLNHLIDNHLINVYGG
ncbi:CBS domain-containing protein [Candidatus Nitrospira allomarina]|jgi:CBS domain-containing protein|uniref:CBS domain-containing protein n=1 Tax=Candidatus Nitrospira allomarina TaxID=3020900 RepID=A0AA96JUC5_9BACT|nr:CBS domain-containing protein [Candidatus Nitrospira allomarina]WNM60000.1 CBS domain-containing protein [Candidatus Nitrospira allomarina]